MLCDNAQATTFVPCVETKAEIYWAVVSGGPAFVFTYCPFRNRMTSGKAVKLLHLNFFVWKIRTLLHISFTWLLQLVLLLGCLYNKEDLLVL